MRDKYFGCLPCLSCTICLRIHERSPRRQKQRRADVPDTSVDSRQSLFSRVFGVGVALSRSSMNRLVAAVRRGISACAQICSRAASSAKVSFLAGAKYMQTRCGDWFPHERRRHVPTRTRGHAAQGRGKQVTRARVACTMPRGAALARVAAARRTQRETVCSRHGRIGAAVPVRVASWRAVCTMDLVSPRQRVRGQRLACCCARDEGDSSSRRRHGFLFSKLRRRPRNV